MPYKKSSCIFTTILQAKMQQCILKQTYEINPEKNSTLTIKARRYIFHKDTPLISNPEDTPTTSERHDKQFSIQRDINIHILLNKSLFSKFYPVAVHALHISTVFNEAFCDLGVSFEDGHIKWR